MGTTVDEDVRAIMAGAKALAIRVDRLRRRLDRDAGLLTPVQYDRVGGALERVGAMGAALLLNDLARTMLSEEDPPEDDAPGPVPGQTAWTDGRDGQA